MIFLLVFAVLMFLPTLAAAVFIATVMAVMMALGHRHAVAAILGVFVLDQAKSAQPIPAQLISFFEALV